MRNSSGSYTYFADGNKNIRQLINNSSSAVITNYDYTPFGKLYASSGTMAAANPFKFSSEYFDDETELVYYNYRYYDAKLGRWLSRDPIAEKGGMELTPFGGHGIKPHVN